MATPEQAPTAPRTAPGGAGRVPREELELRVGEMRQLFNAMDPAPFRERDLDPNAEEYIVEWGRETRAGAPLGLVVQLSREPATPENAAAGSPPRPAGAHRSQSSRPRSTTWRNSSPGPPSASSNAAKRSGYGGVTTMPGATTPR